MSEGKQAQLSKYTVVIDCAYQHLMDERETKSLSRQIQELYSINRHQMKEPVRIVVTSEYEEMKLDKGMDVGRTAEPFYEHLEGKFVYLTPDAEEELEEVREDEIYVVGGLVDK